MSVAPYPEYKDTISILLGAVPAHWSIIQMKRFAPLIYGDALPTTDRAIDGSVPVYGSNGPVGTHDTANTGAPVIIIGRKGSYGAVNWSPEPAFVIDTAYFIDEARARCDLRWLYWAYQAAGLNSFSQDTGVPGLARELVHEMIFVLPSMTEQSAIAAFLDQETGKIDALVAEQERLIALLKEKRQAVISQAVTKGLTPNAPMKDSGIEWLGQVPAHWRVGKAGFYLDVLSGFAFPSEGFSEDEQATRLLRGINVSVGEIRWDDVVYWRRRPDDQLERYLLRQGDLVIGMDRPWIAAGVRVARLGENDTPCLLLQRVARLSVNSKLNDEYLYSLLASDFFIAHFSPDMTGVSVPHISPDQIKSFVIPIPPIPEQHAIISHLKTVVEEIDTLISEATQAIALLRERRAALISAAVTGKIDVRSLAPTKQEAA